MTTQDILKYYKLSNTPTRRAIIELYLKKQQAYSHREVEEALKDELDRITVYRTLLAFEERGILHKVLDGSTSMKYALSQINFNETSKTPNTSHVHFKCEKCQKVECLKNVVFPAVNLPKGYKLNSTFYLAQGLCNVCAI